MDINPPKNLCRLPWAGFSNDPDGRVRACCIYKDTVKNDDGTDMYVQTSSMHEIFHSSYMKKLRQDFRDNKQPAGCSTCWIDEKNGYYSKRLRHINDVDFIKDCNLEVDWRTEPETYPIEYQMIINNSCNLKCRSCSPSHSTLWQADFEKLLGHKGYSMPHGQVGKETGVLWQDRHSWYKYIRRLEIVGGEPFYIKQWATILNELMDLGYAKNITIDMSTNCSIINIDLVRKMAANFRIVGIGLSIDGQDKVYEYLRHPAKWSVSYGNLKKYHQLFDEVNGDRHPRVLNYSLSMTISWLNAWYLPEYHTMVREEFPNFRLWNNLVHSPTHMALWSAPEPLKKAILEKWNNYKWDPQYLEIIEGIKTYMMSRTASPEDHRENLKKILEVDSFRKESFTKSFPEIADYVLSPHKKVFLQIKDLFT